METNSRIKGKYETNMFILNEAERDVNEGSDTNFFTVEYIWTYICFSKSSGELALPTISKSFSSLRITKMACPFPCTSHSASLRFYFRASLGWGWVGTDVPCRDLIWRRRSKDTFWCCLLCQEAKLTLLHMLNDPEALSCCPSSHGDMVLCGSAGGEGVHRWGVAQRLAFRHYKRSIHIR